MKPRPKQELIIEVLETSTGFGDDVLKIFAHSGDARSWIEDQGPQFGELVDLNNGYRLFLSPGFDAQEVKAYLAGMKDS